MLSLVLIVVLGLALLLGEGLAQHVRVAPPVMLLVIGALLGFIPALRAVHLPPQVMLLVFLPALLFWESLNTSLREIRRDLRGILLMSTTLVIATAGAVAAVAHALGLGWGPAWVLGAAVAPTDATAVGVLAQALPRRNITLLRAESLINDGTALVIYSLAVSTTAGEDHFTVPHVSWLFLFSYTGGVLAGALVAWVAIRARRIFDNPLLGNVTALLTPFAAFLVAELIHASGVLAVVVAGLIISQAAPRMVRAVTRRQGEEFWSLSTFVINGSLFVLVGLEAQSSVRSLHGVGLANALIAVGVVTAVVIAARFAFLFTVPFVIRLLDRRPQQRLRRVNNRARVVSALSGFRGAVSLAVALAVPTALNSGRPFPDRDTIVFVTSGVIVTTLLVQGLLLPTVVRWARLRDTSVQEERFLAETTATEEALKALPQVSADLGTDPAVTDRTRQEYETHLQVLRASGEEADDADALRHDQHYTALRLELLARKRATVVRLRDEGRIDDTVLRHVQRHLDIEEVRLLPPQPPQ
ncbi:Na+/H+ antiporter [Streptomyces sp. Go40/10]|uniref:Na+/H+ antiporter n=1 Tax=Streptomyces sp. Go40/10 TaxID=2825844 RepID=UPI001E3ABA59|nr:Na+/H+ antiporter [Streptomyces sp. Go40/10]UFQ99744.1 Na+/H+ antiporter [Streptomyces sp. Go40/10]UFR07202.1 Na+/H+ antiporter [Streptomyces sp. Go40/10]